MFNSYRREISNTYYTSPDTIDVHEHRAPTDDSIRLFDEILDKAQARVVNTFKLESKFAHAVVVVFANQDLTCELQDMKVWVRFKLNGEDEIIKFDLDKFEVEECRRMGRNGHVEFIKKIHKQMSDIIAIRMLQQIDLEETVKHLRR